MIGGLFKIVFYLAMIIIFINFVKLVFIVYKAKKRVSEVLNNSGFSQKEKKFKKKDKGKTIELNKNEYKVD